MNEAYQRMKALLEKTGMRFTPGGITNAEISAYAQGIELVKNAFEAAEGAVFILTFGKPDYNYFASLLCLDSSRYTEQELQNEIIYRLSHSFGDYTADCFVNDFNKIGSGSYEHMSIDYGEGVEPDCKDIVFSDVDRNDLAELGKFIKAYQNGDNSFYDGTGLTFDEWHDWGLTFNEYDALGLPFNILDHLSI